MVEHNDIRDDACRLAQTMLAAVAMSTAGTDEQAAVEAHVDHCSSCRREYDRIAGVGAVLERAMLTALGEQAATAPDTDESVAITTVPADLRGDIVNAIAAESRGGSASVGVPSRVWGSGARLWQARFVMLAGAACMVLALVVGMQARAIDGLKGDVDRLEGRTTLAVLSGASVKNLKESGSFGDATAQVAIVGDSGLVAVRDVPDPPQGRAWAIWQVDKDRKITQIALLTEGTKALFVPLDDIDPDELARVMVTVENAPDIAGGDADTPADKDSAPTPSDDRVAVTRFA